MFVPAAYIHFTNKGKSKSDGRDLESDVILYYPETVKTFAHMPNKRMIWHVPSYRLQTSAVVMTWTLAEISAVTRLMRRARTPLL